jgi:hypothetical protein
MKGQGDHLTQNELDKAIVLRYKSGLETAFTAYAIAPFSIIPRSTACKRLRVLGCPPWAEHFSFCLFGGQAARAWRGH